MSKPLVNNRGPVCFYTFAINIENSIPTQPVPFNTDKKWSSFPLTFSKQCRLLIILLCTFLNCVLGKMLRMDDSAVKTKKCRNLFPIKWVIKLFQKESFRSGGIEEYGSSVVTWHG